MSRFRLKVPQGGFKFKYIEPIQRKMLAEELMLQICVCIVSLCTITRYTFPRRLLGNRTLLTKTYINEPTLKHKLKAKLTEPGHVE